MNAATIERWILNLGRPYDTLVAEGIIPNLPFQELYKGRDWLDIEPGDGLELSFWAETKRFERLFITLIQTVEDQTVYRGELPQPFALEMDQAGVHRTFGPPRESSGPRKIPNIGMVGGHDAYTLDAATHPNGQVMFQYTADMRVKTLFFTLVDAGHD
ncbi:DUF6392 family protein [Pseudomonas aeruginosa]|uniref:DUF6392 family protein n=1 Tax=Pseudomonas aeruginosa TaxID=287 RepID=UPI000EAC8113|nr:DUF6392 family protein [Pseudomonas aeruginosa]MBU5956555.1 hypothetical protein [Pseudomonas aeruginosa]MCT2410455.1 DUF6392 family protein [Pseudomonas aeruginosa]MCT4938106.1 DUF6392 family protein [Pseudomonas aeruginosa]MEB6158389.1 DUF6392 family protein [Pseudomonas aeruginosa]RPX45474.1 hypothetical protein IPC725_03435 [Pseudomonas aeruginosa]